MKLCSALAVLSGMVALRAAFHAVYPWAVFGVAMAVTYGAVVWSHLASRPREKPIRKA